MSATLLISVVALALPEPAGAFDPQARLEGQRQDCRSAPKEAEEVVVCGRRVSPYRIDKGVLATMPPDPRQQRKRDIGQAALNKPYCPPSGPNACELSGKAAVPVITMVLKALKVISGTPVRDVLRTSPDPYKVYQGTRDRAPAQVSSGPKPGGSSPPHP